MAAAHSILRRDKVVEARPDGDTNNAGHWCPSEEEERPCCVAARRQSRSMVYKHCFSIAHMAELYDVERSVLEPLIHKIEDQLPLLEQEEWGPDDRNPWRPPGM